MTKQQENQTHYRRFASWLSREIAKYGKTVGDYYDRQKGQFDHLVELETEFRKVLQSTKKGRDVYVKFIRFIRDERRSILAARPYFRERQQLFTDVISDALKTRDAVLLYRFRFNFLFVQFALKAQKWPVGSKVMLLATAIRKIRTEIVEMNMPLAISRARIFWGRTPKSHLALMDFVQIASVGLMSGIDKFVPPFAKVFRSVAIGRMTGNFIQEYCVDPATKVLTTDLKWVRADSLSVGDGVVGFDEHMPGPKGRRKWAKATVTENSLRNLPKRRIVTDQVTVVVSDGHKFLCSGGKGAEWKCSLRARSMSPAQKGLGHRWVRADQLEPGDEIMFLGKPWDVGGSFDHGYLKGIADGEGCVSRDAVVAIAQKPGVVSDEIGGGEVRPARLLQKSETVYVDKAIGRGRKLRRFKVPTKAVVCSNEPVGVGPVVTLGTSTGTLVTEGLLSHNSETPIHFFPTDKRKIYNGNKLVGKINRKNSGATDYVQLAAEINLGDISGKYQTTPVEIAGLMAAASVVSADSIVTSDPDSPEPLVRFAAPESVRPDRQLEERDAMRTMAYAIEKLTVFERKLLRLRGLTF